MVELGGHPVVERPQVFVVDASVAVKWYVGEEDRDKALDVREDYLEGKIDLASPALVLYELFNALRYHPALSPADVARYMDSLPYQSPSRRDGSGSKNEIYDENEHVSAVPRAVQGYVTCTSSSSNVK